MSLGAKISDKIPSRRANALLINSPPVSKRTSPPPFKCPLCSAAHRLFRCQKFLRQSIHQRYSTIRQLKRCFNCFWPHSKSECTSTYTCRTSQSPNHHTLLHPGKTSSSPVAGTSASEVLPAEVPPPSSTSALSCQAASSPQSHMVLLATVQALIQDSAGDFHLTRAVVDPGSQMSIISSPLVRRLGLKCTKSTMPVRGISNTSTTSLGVVACTLKSRFNSFTISTPAVVLSSITSNLPTLAISAEVCRRFSCLNLADSEFHTPGRVDFLIGADIYDKVLVGGPDSFRKGSPSALNTMFGWILSGQVDGAPAPAVTSLLSTGALFEDQIRSFWESEEVSLPPLAHPDDDLCEALFRKHHYRDTTGRYLVPLPFRQNCSPLGDNRNAALQCFLNLEHRLKRKPAILDSYRSFMSDYISLGHMTPAREPSPYLTPHHGVMTTKLRVVFNGSFSGGTHSSLNLQLLPGPKLQRELAPLLLAFRFHKVALCADIRMMYRQVLIRPEDRHF